MIDAVTAAIRAKLAITPTDLAQMVKAGLLIREGHKKVEEAIDLGDHESSP